MPGWNYGGTPDPNTDYKPGADPYANNPKANGPSPTKNGPGGVVYGGVGSEGANSWNNDNDAANWDSNGHVVPQFGGGAGQATSVANQYGALAGDAQKRTAVYMGLGNANHDRELQFDTRGQQQNSLSLMQQAAEGSAPSAAQTQMGMGINSSIAAQMAMANSTRGGGGNIALAQRQAASSGEAMQMQGVNQASALRAQEMATARGQYSQAAASQRAQDLQAQGLDAQTAYQQATLEAQQRALNDQTALGYGGLANQVNLGQLQADTASYQAQYGLAGQQAQADAAKSSSLISGGAGMMAGAGALMMMSDANVKTEIRGEGNKSEADALLESLKPFSYAYKERQDEPSTRPNGGRYLGIIAQNVERAGSVGRQIVIDTPRGKAIQIPAMVSALSAATGRLHERLARLEGK